MDWQELIFYTVGGLALFLYGVTLISSGLQKALGDKAAKLLEKITNNPLKGLAVGTGTTTIFQSSSLTMVTLIGLVNASLLNLEQAIGVMLGAEIGTTITAQLVSFNIKEFVLPIIAVGFILSINSKKQNLKYVGQAILGFGILFLGMDLMKTGVGSLKDVAYFSEIITKFGVTPLLGVLAAAVFTAVVQSSSATTGLVIALASQGLVTIESAVPLILGANIGTTVTGVLASLGSSKTSKRLAFVQVLFNVAGVGLLLLILGQFVELVTNTSGDLARQVANAHTIFNIVSAAIGLFFIKFFAELAEKVIPGKDPRKDRSGTKYLDPAIINSPSIAIAQARKELIRVAKKVDSMFGESALLLSSYSKNNYQQVIVDEDTIDGLYKSINDFLTSLTERPISADLSEKITMYVHANSDLERISDHIRNVAQIYKNINYRGIPISAEAKRDIRKMNASCQKLLKGCERVIRSEKKAYYQELREMKYDLDDLERKILDRHIERLKVKKCKPEADVVFVNIIRNLSSVSGHTMNIARGFSIANHDSDIYE